METGLWALGTAIVSFAITAVIGKFLIPFLRRLKYGQTILEEGPNWHKSKQGTPTMGGIMFIIGIILSLVAVFLTGQLSGSAIFGDIGARAQKARLLFVSIVLFYNIFVKITKKTNNELSHIKPMNEVLKTKKR